MNPDQWQRVEELYYDALDVPEAARAAFVARACAGDAALQHEVASLLAARAGAQGFLQPPPGLPEPVASNALSGQSINHYQVGALLGKGGMGEVYLAEDTRLNRRVALKILPAQFSHDPERVRRFEREARAVSLLNHPHILTIHELGQTADGAHFLVTEFVEGQTLRQLLNAQAAGSRTLPPREAIQLVTQIAEALAAAHTAGIIHRDIKPENVMVRRDGHVKVLDFGLAKVAEAQADASSADVSEAGKVLGTVSYMSPEQARGQEVDARSDIFSLGVVLYEMLAGRPPFDGETVSDVLAAILRAEPLPLARFVPAPPGELQRIVQTALVKERAHRYQSIQDLALDLKQLAAELAFNARLLRATPRQFTPEEAGARRLDAVSHVSQTVCQHCQLTNPAAAKFCLQCGSALAARCANCQTTLPPGAKFCMGCGQQVGGATPADRDRLARLAAATPSSLANKIRAAEPTVGERKIVTALFAEFSVFAADGAELDPEDWPAVINQALERFSPTIFYYEGAVAQVLGNSLLAFFGAPLAHEDDAVRAVRAALEITASARQLARELKERQAIEFELRIGLNTGPIVLGKVSSQLKFEFTVVGDTVNLATRAQAVAAPMAVLVTEATQRQIAAVFACGELSHLGVKGRSGAVRVAAVQGSRTALDRVHGLAGLHSQMVGRAAELDALLQLSHALQAGLGRAAVIIGEPGLGKTRLLAEWKAAVPPAALRWVEGACLSYGQTLAYHLLQSLLRSLLKVTPQAATQTPAHIDEAATRAALSSLTAALLGEHAREVFPYLAHLLALELAGPDLERVAQLDPQLLQTQYLISLRRLLAALAAQQPLALLLEDIHWADPSSVELLNKLLPLANEAPLLFCFVARPERETPGWKLVTAARGTLGGRLTELTLRELSEAESQQLLANLLNHATLPAATRDVIFHKAEGNPFFVEEIIRMLIERGALVRRAEQWQAPGEISAAEIPDNLQSLLLARIDRLPEDVKRVLRVAAVIGRQFSAQVLEQVLK